jgi:hypothetical protein
VRAAPAVPARRRLRGRAGAIPLLVSMLETGGARGKKDAATTLYALCSGARENRQRGMETGAVRPLDLMADPESGMVDKAAYVLHSLVSPGEGHATAIEEGGIPVLVEMVEVGTSREKEIATLSLLQIGIDRDGADGDRGAEGGGCRRESAQIAGEGGSGSVIWRWRRTTESGGVREDSGGGSGGEIWRWRRTTESGGVREESGGGSDGRTVHQKLWTPTLTS